MKDLGLTYEQAAHGVQSAIMHAMNQDNGSGLVSGTSPKHLRVGVDSAHVTDYAVAELLMEKGVFTREEYEEKVRLAMNDELAKREDAAKHVNNGVTISFR